MQAKCHYDTVSNPPTNINEKGEEGREGGRREKGERREGEGREDRRKGRGSKRENRRKERG